LVPVADGQSTDDVDGDVKPRVVTSFQEQVEWHLRIASLLVGLAVGILSLVAMARKMRRR
jgi:hypothetical protein